MENTLIFFLEICCVTVFTLSSLRFGKEGAIAWVGFLSIVMNLFILKQITLFGLEVTCTDSFAVGYLLALNLLQEFYGKKTSALASRISLFLCGAFSLFSYLQLLYCPSINDLSDEHYKFLLTIQPRILLASWFTLLVVQAFDRRFYTFLSARFPSRFLVLKMTFCLIVSQSIDTVLFTFLGLWKMVPSIFDVICLSLIMKLFSIVFCVAVLRFIPSTLYKVKHV